MALKLRGTYRIAGSQRDTWETLLDPSALEAAIPGCEEFVATGPFEWQARVSVGVGPIRGTYAGTVEIVEQDAPRSCVLVISGKGGPGYLRGRASVKLSPADVAVGETIVEVEAEGIVGGLVASVGDRMLGSVGQMLMGQFFERLGSLVNREANLQ